MRSTVQEGNEEEMSVDRLKTVLLLNIVLGVAVLATLGPVLGNPFLAYEDWLFVTRNGVVQGGLTWAGVQWAFSTYQTGNWYPLTWLSHMVDAQVYGLNPRGHHLTNLLFHLVNTLLVFSVLVRATGCLGRSVWVAALFALHPLHVESVAWVSERKDVLSTFFWLLAMLTYQRYVRTRSVATYLGALLVVTLGLMSKPMLVTLPFVLLLFDVWPLRRLEERDFSWKRVLGEKVPFFALSAACSVITIVAQRSVHAVAGLDVNPLGARVVNSVLAYAMYLRKTIVPFDLAVFYPYPTGDELTWLRVGAALSLLLSVTAVALRTLRTRPYVAFGWFWYLGTLVPVIGLVQVGSQAYADRYTYVPLLGIFVALVWTIAEVVSRSPVAKRFAVCLGGSLLVVLAVLTRKQISYWQDDVSLFRHAIAATRENYLAENLLGLGYVSQGHREEALACFRRSVALEPSFAEGHNNLGMVLLEVGRLSAARQSFEQALRVNPQMAKAHLNLGGVFFEERNYEEAAAHYREAVRVDPGYALAHRNLGVTLQAMGRIGDARDSFKRAVALNPGDEVSIEQIRGLTEATSVAVGR